MVTKPVYECKASHIAEPVVDGRGHDKAGMVKNSPVHDMSVK